MTDIVQGCIPVSLKAILSIFQHSLKFQCLQKFRVGLRSIDFILSPLEKLPHSSLELALEVAVFSLEPYFLGPSSSFLSRLLFDFEGCCKNFLHSTKLGRTAWLVGPLESNCL